MRALVAPARSQPRRRIFSSAGSTPSMNRRNAFYVRLIRAMVQRSGLMVVIALVLVALAGWGLTKIPTGFIPTEDQGYLMVAVQVPDGASLDRTEQVMDEIARIGLQDSGSGTRHRHRDGRAFAARWRRLPGQRGHRLPDAQELGRARQRRGPAAHLSEPRRATRDGPGGTHASADSAAHPGPRRCRAASRCRSS